MLDFEPQLLKSQYAESKARYYTASDYHEMYKSGQVTPIQVAEALLPQISRPDGKYSDGWVDNHGKDHLVLEAAKASTERYAAGKPLGVLDGVPIGVKDDTDVEGFHNHIGMKYEPSIETFKEQKESSWPVKKLQEAGAVVIGKNAMHELGSGESTYNVFLLQSLTLFRYQWMQCKHESFRIRHH
jgi:Asp-tRNA(Asn)/Glu-tRNA(Gln) amidotransferase A subunit family amidase